MIIRPTAKLAEKIGVRVAESAPADLNPFADWSAHLSRLGAGSTF